jgi:carbonic anhydrase
METRKSLFLRTLVALALAVAPLTASAAEQESISAEDSLALLLQGNQFYARGSLGNLVGNSRPKIRRQLAAGQHPYAIVVDCSDSRLPPEIVFDKGLGEIFVIRVAGNLVARQQCGGDQLGSHELGSIEYAVEHLGAKLILVLGHEKCGAVKAAAEYSLAPDPKPELGPNLLSIVDAILPAVEAVRDDDPDLRGPALYEASADENIRQVVEQIETDSAIVQEFMNPCSPTTEAPVNDSPTDGYDFDFNVAGPKCGVKITGYKYGIESGLVREIVPLHGNTSP